MLQRLKVSTSSRIDLVNITQKVEHVTNASGVTSGICYVFVPHTTAGITLNENADQGVLLDIVERLSSIAPEGARYHHMEGNGPAHVKASLMGHSEPLLIENGSLVLGTWQGIFLCEFDGPRERQVIIKVVED